MVNINQIRDGVYGNCVSLKFRRYGLLCDLNIPLKHNEDAIKVPYIAMSECDEILLIDDKIYIEVNNRILLTSLSVEFVLHNIGCVFDILTSNNNMMRNSLISPMMLHHRTIQSYFSHTNFLQHI